LASIPGPLVLAVGFVVSVLSFFLNKKTFSFVGAYSLFLYFGIILLLYGFVKTLIWFMTRRSPEDLKAELKKEISEKNSQIRSASAFDESQKKDFDEDRYRLVIRCKNCAMPHHIYANFCQNCGARILK
jgi:hypothetical protein